MTKIPRISKKLYVTSYTWDGGVKPVADKLPQTLEIKKKLIFCRDEFKEKIKYLIRFNYI